MLEFNFTSTFISQNQDGFQTVSSSYENGRIACAFNRSIIAENIAEDRNLNESVYLLLAVGSQRGRASFMCSGISVLYAICVLFLFGMNV